MAKYLFQVAQAADSILARDQVVNTFHLSDVGTGSDPGQLARDTIDLWQTLVGAQRQIEVRVYNAEAASGPPVAVEIENVGQAPASGFPREVALCLSYYGERNLPRTRGRIYLCAALLTNATVNQVRPDNSNRALAMQLGAGLANLGGADVDWVTWSRIDGANEKVQHYWCDDEWDTIRSRGLRATTRNVADTGE